MARRWRWALSKPQRWRWGLLKPRRLPGTGRGRTRPGAARAGRRAIRRRELRRRAHHARHHEAISTRERQITDVSKTETYGIGVRARVGGSWGFAATRDLSKDAVARTARETATASPQATTE